MEVRARKLLQAAESVTMIPSLTLHAEFVSCSCPCPESWISSPARRLPLPAGQAAFALPACLPPRPASSSQGSPAPRELIACTILLSDKHMSVTSFRCQRRSSVWSGAGEASPHMPSALITRLET